MYEMFKIYAKCSNICTKCSIYVRNVQHMCEMFYIQNVQISVRNVQHMYERFNICAKCWSNKISPKKVKVSPIYDQYVREVPVREETCSVSHSN